MTSKIEYDGTFDLATGRSRWETKWKNERWLWSALVKKISTTVRTKETYSEYLAATKKEQTVFKDRGAFLAGKVEGGGNRNAGSIKYRQVLALDLDYAPQNFWADFKERFQFAAAVYTTHTHSSEKPRFRLLIPLDRQVTADEYSAIARKIADDIGIQFFDPTTYQPERLMFWASTSVDGDFFSDNLDAPWLVAQEVLDRYIDWRDRSQWPVGDLEVKQVTRAIKKQGDPLEKSGLIGAFCRTHSIDDVMNIYLQDVYADNDINDRYTYIPGSSYGGVIVYEDKYAFSHHSTDPACQKLCNAFDLVRIHKFGLEDKKAKVGTPSNRLPSFELMMGLAAKDPEVMKLYHLETLAEARASFSGINDEEAVNSDWMDSLKMKGKKYVCSIDNIVIILTNDEYFKGRLAFNECEMREVAVKDLPWRKKTGKNDLNDKDDASIRHYLEKAFGIANTAKINDALSIIMQNNSFHPVRNHLESCVWDGVLRVDTLLVDYLGAADNEYVRTVTRKSLVAAVARIFKPGIKFDNVLTLVGKQGIGKSTLIKKLGRGWYSDSFGTIQGKEAFESIQGVWLLEMGELAGLRKADMETIKQFISKQDDRYRVAYGKRTEVFARQCVFFATTNNKDFLRDPTGNRRFWPVDLFETVPVKNIFEELTASEVDQVWAEAVKMYNDGETLFLTKELEIQACAVQLEHSELDDRLGAIEKYLETLLPPKWEDMEICERRAFLSGDITGGGDKGTIERKRVCVAEIWCEVFHGFTSDMTRFNTKFLHDIMRNMDGWTEYKSRTDFKRYGTQKAYGRDVVISGMRVVGKDLITTQTASKLHRK